MKDVRFLFEDEDIIAVSKPIGLVVDAGRERITDEVEDLVAVVSGMGRKVFPYHRLDRDTSGIVLLGKSRRHARDFTKLFEEKRIRKSYLAVVTGAWPRGLNRVDLDIGGKDSITTFRLLASSVALREDEKPVGDAKTPSEFSARNQASLPSRSWLEALPKTGRKHQIRIHCAKSGHPIMGDAVYGAGESGLGHALHAYQLQFKHPRTKADVLILDPPFAWRASWLKGLDFESAWTKLFSSDETVVAKEDQQ